MSDEWFCTCDECMRKRLQFMSSQIFRQIEAHIYPDLYAANIATSEGVATWSTLDDLIGPSLPDTPQPESPA